MFSPLVMSHWVPQGCQWNDLPAGELTVAIHESLPANRSAMILQKPDRGGVLTLSHDHALTTGLVAGASVSMDRAQAALAAAGIVLNDPDHVFYLDVDEQSTVLDESASAGTRPLSAEDKAAFARFSDLAPADDLDEAIVELDHWLVFGTFVAGQLVCAASMYPWTGTRLADLGVITLPAHRGQGWAHLTVRAMSAHALAAGYEPQYRCQTDNDPSIALARAAGFKHFGIWSVVEPED